MDDGSRDDRVGGWSGRPVEGARGGSRRFQQASRRLELFFRAWRRSRRWSRGHGHPVPVFQRVDQAGYPLRLDERVVRRGHALRVRSRSPCDGRGRRREIGRSGSGSAARDCLCSPHHDVGGSGDREVQRWSTRHHETRSCRASNAWSVHRSPDGGPRRAVENRHACARASSRHTRIAPLSTNRDLDKRGWLDGSPTSGFQAPAPLRGDARRRAAVHVLAASRSTCPGRPLRTRPPRIDSFLWMLRRDRQATCSSSTRPCSAPCSGGRERRALLEEPRHRRLTRGRAGRRRWPAGVAAAALAATSAAHLLVTRASSAAWRERRPVPCARSPTRRGWSRASDSSPPTASRSARRPRSRPLLGGSARSFTTCGSTPPSAASSTGSASSSTSGAPRGRRPHEVATDSGARFGERIVLCPGARPTLGVPGAELTARVSACGASRSSGVHAGRRAA